MAQIAVTRQMMIDYARSLDERLVDRQKYPDSWIVGKINTAFEVISTRRQPFYAEEVLDLNPYIIDGVDKIEAIMQYDVLGYKRIFTTVAPIRIDALNNDNVITKLGVEWVVRPDNIVDVWLDTATLNPDNVNNITFQYFYIPTVPELETYMSADIYHLLRHGIEFSIWESLRDREKFEWAAEKIEQGARSVINGLDIDIKASDQYNGGFML